MTAERPYNFAPGPAMLPEPVLLRIQKELLNYHGCGWSILEAGHRSAEGTALMRDLRARIRNLLAVPDNYDVLFCQGGGRMQFSMVPMNLLGAGTLSAYIITGSWSKAAAKEALRFGRVQTAFSGSGTRAPADEEIEVIPEASYCAYCDNETIHGVEFPEPPTLAGAPAVPLVSDMSSNFMTRPVDVSRFGLIWAAAQKNFGVAGLTVVLLRRDLLGLAAAEVPTLLNYGVYSRTESVPNTVPVFQLYVAELVAEWIDAQGGLARMDELARIRSRLVYDAVAAMPDVYVSHIAPESRSRVNAVFRLRNESLTQTFVKEAAAAGLANLAGHRSVGGVRASMYNAMPVEGAEALAAFMKTFAGRHPEASRTDAASARAPQGGTNTQNARGRK